jgi:DNA polymerase-3 subunit gamma/tau
LPDPARLIATIEGDSETSSNAPAAPGSGARAAARTPRDFRGLIAAVESSGKHLLAQQLHDQVGLVRFAPPELVLKPSRPLGGDWPLKLARDLKEVTGTNWQVALSDEAGEPSLLDQEKMAEERVRAEVLADPAVSAVVAAFPDAELESFTTRGA